MEQLTPQQWWPLLRASNCWQRAVLHPSDVLVDTPYAAFEWAALLLAHADPNDPAWAAVIRRGLAGPLEIAAAHASLSVDNAARIVRRRPSAVAGNEHLDPSTVTGLIVDAAPVADATVRALLANRSWVAAANLERPATVAGLSAQIADRLEGRFAGELDERMLSILAGNPATPVEVLAWFGADDDPFDTLATNLSTPAEVLERLSHDRRISYVASNPAAPPAALEHISANVTLHNMAWRHPNLDSATFQMLVRRFEANAPAFAAVTANPQFDPARALALIASPATPSQVLTEALQHPDLDEAALAAIYDRSDDDFVRRAIMQRWHRRRSWRAVGTLEPDPSERRRNAWAPGTWHIDRVPLDGPALDADTVEIACQLTGSNRYTPAVAVDLASRIAAQPA